MAKLIINNINKNPLWKKIPCHCDKSNVELSYPLIDCIHCNCEYADNSVPQESFKVNQSVYDEDGNLKETKVVEIKEITLNNCEKYGSVIGWKF